MNFVPAATNSLTNIIYFSAKKSVQTANPFIYYLKIKKMLFNINELETGTYWIVGTKLKQEEKFFVQIFTDYKRYSSVFTKLTNEMHMDFYTMEIELPDKLKPDTVPF